MNKRAFYIILLIVILAGICITEQVLVSNYLNNIQSRVESLVVKVGDMDNINTQDLYNEVLDIEDTWSGYENTLCFFVNLKDIEDVGIELTKMKVYIVENSVEDFKASLALLLYYIDGYYNVMGISFENIF